jgi:4-diphosphocytidyl-2-C-methyl-D-erythritol kinase
MGTAGTNDISGWVIKMMTVVAPAKLNLTLEVLGKREDGYHEIKSIIQTINFCDTLKFSTHDWLEFRCDLPEWSPHRSLVSKAADLLKSTTDGVTKGALIEVTKKIPMSSGLGGDSSDAVAVLRGLNMLWGLKLSLPDLLKIGSQLGSDLPLFLYGGTVLAEGRGEKITPVHPMPHMSVVLLSPALPEVKDKTKRMYSRLRVTDYTRGEVTQNFLNILANRENSPLSGLYNVFDKAGLNFFRGLRDYKEKFREAGAQEVHLAGAGPALFTLTPDEVQANTIYKRLLEMGVEAYLADF